MPSSSIASETPSRPTRTRNPVINPGMVSPSIDSRRRLSISSGQVQTQQSKRKRKAPANDIIDDSDIGSDSSVVCLKATRTKKKSASRSKHQATSQEEVR